MCNHRQGHDLSDKTAHKQDHQKWSRRSFLTTMGLTASMSMLLGKIPLTAYAGSPLAYALNQSESDRILVLIRLAGGNDGLNTIIPLYDYSNYKKFRPTLAIPQNELFKLNDEVGIPRYMNSLESLWKGGGMKVVNGVGYPNQDYSHFNSMKIWETASDSDNVGESGWMGRFFENQYPDFLLDGPDIPPVIQIGGTQSITFTGNNIMSVATVADSAERFEELVETGEAYNVTNLPGCRYGEKLKFVRAVSNLNYRYTDIIKEAYDRSKNDVEYVGDDDFFGAGLARQLAFVARLIKGNLGTRVYMVELDGFDTHEAQAYQHMELMTELANAVSKFYEDLATANLSDKVLSMTFSEFGRTIQENASEGTDHGAAAPVLFFGGDLNGGGMEGELPSLSNLGEYEDFPYTTDFRSIYATVLQDWMCVDGELVDKVMGKSFEKLSGLVNACNSSQPVGLANNGVVNIIDAQARYDGNGNIAIHYGIASANRVRVELFNMAGQPVQVLVDQHQQQGNHQCQFNPHAKKLPAGQYLYRIRAGEDVASGSVGVF